jgi:cation diffusion facilitator CzcD-associated flavoprotein CzcO
MADVVVVGAGPAGLATVSELRLRGVKARLLERGNRPGYSWANLYDSLTLHTGKHLSTLPGLPFPRGTPIFPTRLHFLDYLEGYADLFGIQPELNTQVTKATPMNGSGWKLETNLGDIDASIVVFATGIMANPVVPEIPCREMFRGRVLHSIEYRQPAPFVGHSVLVVGVGNSGGEIGSELSRSGARVTVAVRSGANVVPLKLLGLPIQYLSFALRKLPRAAQNSVVAAVGKITEARRGPPVLPRPPYGPLDSIPLIGFNLVDEIRARRIRVAPAIERFTTDGVRFNDGSEDSFDDVVLATGFRPALDALQGHVRVDARGFALRSDRVTSADQKRLYFVGHNYDSTGGLRNIWMDAPLVAARISWVLAYLG